jgi:hypothetical protein
MKEQPVLGSKFFPLPTKNLNAVYHACSALPDSREPPRRVFEQWINPILLFRSARAVLGFDPKWSQATGPA